MNDEAKRCIEALRVRCRERDSCDGCPKDDYCHYHGNESLNDFAAHLIESLSAELEQVEAVAAQARGLECERDQLKARLEHVEFERDAAVEDLRKVCKATEVCFCCKSFDAGYTEYVSNDCMDCIKHCNWQWRGVQKEESHD